MENRFWEEFFRLIPFVAATPLAIYMAVKVLIPRLSKWRQVDSASESHSQKKPRSSRKSYKATSPGANQRRSEGSSTSEAIFVSYRREDSADIVGRICDRLKSEYGKEKVFTDVDSIPLGVDFRDYIDDSVSRADALLAIIGPDWLACTKGATRKIDDSRDYVRLEIKSALDRQIPVIPVLVRNASMPDEDELPTDIQGLLYRNGTPIRSDPDFESDISRLIVGLKRYI